VRGGEVVEEPRGVVIVHGGDGDVDDAARAVERLKERGRGRGSGVGERREGGEVEVGKGVIGD